MKRWSLRFVILIGNLSLSIKSHCFICSTLLPHYVFYRFALSIIHWSKLVVTMENDRWKGFIITLYFYFIFTRIFSLPLTLLFFDRCIFKLWRKQSKYITKFVFSLQKRINRISLTTNCFVKHVENYMASEVTPNWFIVSCERAILKFIRF